ncbi:hypothetical protein HYPSUDRAFT_44530 [Hypholoma sublateritium FD-334 SS-4]|uniref:F-box domain-containing protein n=1 Tax=Hypholoma sublateritium (strain FD-334 SS-4) TaxID=945553 RepID=A0A0D2NQL7_HYPSF|nr:hypothetical protein HYPSUDRAFT_44530 [Hypholoma sublateritium FD-334 SS-4]
MWSASSEAMGPSKDIETATTHQTQDNDACLPIFSIPNEITMLIFSFACHPSPIFGQSRMHGFNAEELSHFAREEGHELTVSHVCRSWRSISLAYAELWSSFHYFSKYNRQHFTARRRAYLERAQSSLLTLWVCFSSTEDVTNIFQMLRCTNNSRWRKISLLFDRNYSLERKMVWVLPRQQHSPDANAHRFSYDNLETLDVGCPDGYWLWMNSDINRIIGEVACTPRLAALRVDAGATILQPFGKMHRASLSVLQLHSWGHWGLSWETFLSIFSNFPNLTTLTISGCIFSSAPSTVTQKVIAPNLQYLRISSNTVLWLWLYLHAPRLRHLSITQARLSDWRFPWGDDILGDASPPMFPSLEVLTLVNCTPHLYDDLRCVASLAHATRTISQLVIAREYSETEPKDARQYEMMVQTPSMRPFWPSNGVSPIHIFYTAPAYGTRNYIDFFRALRVLRWRKRLLGDGWTLRISPAFVRRWSADAPELWEVAVAEGLVEPVLRDERPRPGDVDPCWTYEAGFATY